MGPRVPFAPALLTLSLLITLQIYFISSLLFILSIIRVMVNKAVKKKKLFKLMRKALNALQRTVN